MIRKSLHHLLFHTIPMFLDEIRCQKWNETELFIGRFQMLLNGTHSVLLTFGRKDSLLFSCQAICRFKPSTNFDKKIQQSIMQKGHKPEILKATKIAHSTQLIPGLVWQPWGIWVFQLKSTTKIWQLWETGTTGKKKWLTLCYLVLQAHSTSQEKHEFFHVHLILWAEKE